MSVETELAAAGVKVSWEAIRLILMSIVVIAVLSVGGCKYKSYMNDKAELAGLREYKASVVAQAAVTAAMTESFERQHAATLNLAAGNSAQRVIIETRTQELAHADPTVAAFLACPVPLSLRTQDREARIASELDRGRAAGKSPR